MSRTAARVTQADIARALRAAQQVGQEWQVEIARDGTIRMVRGPLSTQPAPPVPVPGAEEDDWHL